MKHELNEVLWMKHEVKMTWEEDENDTPSPDPRGEWFLYEGDKLGRHVCMLGMTKIPMQLKITKRKSQIHRCPVKIK